MPYKTQLASVTTAGQIIPAPPTGQQIIVHDIYTGGTTNILDGNGGTVILPLDSMISMSFNGGIPFGDAKPVWSDGNNVNVIITYRNEHIMV